MGTTDDFYHRVRAAAANSDQSLVVERTEDGFVLRQDVADARWAAPAQRAGVRQVIAHRVRVDEPGQTYSITDDVYSVDWAAGLDGADRVPTLRFRASRGVGTVVAKGFRTRWVWGPGGRLVKVFDYRYDTGDTRGLITTAAKQVGLEQRLGTMTKVGVVIAGFGLLVGVLGVVLALMVI